MESSKVINRMDKFISFINKFNFLTKLRKKIATRINLFVGKYEKANNLSYILIYIYIIFETIFFLYTIFLKELWYMKLVNLILMIIAPLIIIKAITNVRYKKIINATPDALDEFQYWLFRTKRIDETIKITSENLSGTIKIPFERLYYNIVRNNEERGLQEFKDTFNNEHIDNFVEILRTYIFNGGKIEEIAYQINFESTSFRSDNMFFSKMKERFLKFKIGCIFMVIANIFTNKYIKVLLVDMPYMYTHTISSKFAIVNIYFLILFFIIELFEYI